MLFKTTKEIGDWGEDYAARYLRRHGYRILARNWRYEKCELDIVAASFHEVAFVEVKTRTYLPEYMDTALPPSDAVNADKQRLTKRAAYAYLRQHPTRKQARMDVIEIWLQKAPEGTEPKVLRCNHFKAAY